MIPEIVFKGMPVVLFYLFSAMAVVFSLLVVMLRSPVTSSISLVASLFSASAIYILLDAPFLGVVQVLVYAGAILVLFLYVVMLLNLKSVKIHVNHQRLATAGGMLLMAIVAALFFTFVKFPNMAVDQVKPTFGSLASVGEILLGPYALVFELASLVLLAAIVGTVMLSLPKKEGE